MFITIGTFIIGAVVGGIIELVVQHPFEDLVEKKFQQIMHIGVYRKLFFQNTDYNELKRKLVKAINQYDFEYAKIVLKQLEWFIEEKTNEEKGEAKKLAQEDYGKDLTLINKFKGNKTKSKYIEDKNLWKTNIKNTIKNSLKK